MNRKIMVALGSVFSLIASFSSNQVVLAHETLTVGNYNIEVGWLTEPPIAGQQNAIVVNVFEMNSGEEQPVEDVSQLLVTVKYGGQDKGLLLQPLGEDTPGQFIAPIIPTTAGEYEVRLGGFLGDTTVDAGTTVEEVQMADTLEFPLTTTSPSSGVADWLVWLSLFVGLMGVGMGVVALRQKK